MPSTLSPCGGDQAVREQVQPQVGVGHVGGRRRPATSITVRTGAPLDAAELVRPVERREVGSGPRHRPVARPSAGRGYQTSSTWPPGPTVATPSAQALRCVGTRRRARGHGRLRYPRGASGSLAGRGAADRGAGRHRVGERQRARDRRRGRGRAAAVRAPRGRSGSAKSVVARTNLGRAERVVVAGHLDTVPIADNFPSRLEDGVLHGIGTADMKGGVAVGLRLAATVPAPDPGRDVRVLRVRGGRGRAQRAQADHRRSGLTSWRPTSPC